MLIDFYQNISAYLVDTFSPTLIFVVLFTTTLLSIAYFIFIGYIIAHLDKRYFVQKQTVEKNVTSSALPLNSLTKSKIILIRVAKTLLGFCLLISGIIMLVLPGQGLLTIVVGLSLLPFPGKNKLEKYLLARQSVRSSLNWIRVKAKKEPFEFS